ncbi:alpha/beta fold hydrolase [Falsiroseomonas sp. E2-1-a20]|uniref:alpha/beta fold hydrolase n=1 Tax=Falsiroseomonas sp. E2-1-a20 TaxID=3239300 RepID=UPI003F39FED0
MVARPETRYARSGGVCVAYQVVGRGPVDLVYVPGFINNLDLQWESPGYARLLARLAAFSRLIVFDKRGTGLSDPVAEVPTLEQRMDDVRAVMDAAGSGRAVVLGASEGGAMAALFAATHPARTRALVLYGAYARFCPDVVPAERVEAFLAQIDARWGTGLLLRYFAPALVADPATSAWWARHERLGASPAMAAQLVRMNAVIDVRAALPAIRVPTLVLHRAGDTRTPLAAGRLLAEQIPGARLVEVPGTEHPIWLGDVERVADEVEAFVTGAHPAAPAGGPERVLASVLAAEVGGADRAAGRAGDTVWGSRLAAFRAAAEEMRQRFGGRPLGGPEAVRGDGALLALFDGPARAVRCAAALRDEAERLLDGGAGCGLRCGVHVGEVALSAAEGVAEAGTSVAGDGATGATGGVAVHAAVRIAALAKVGEVLVSGTVRDLVAGSGLRFRERPQRLPLGAEVGGARLPLLSLAGDDLQERLGATARALTAGGASASAPVGAGLPLPAGLAELSPREREVLRLMTRGLSNPAIAATLGVSEHTVKRQAANVLLKLALPSRAAAAALAARAGLT